MRTLAIQIDEKLLSEEAKYFLRNAKNKSQFLRDALEFYVRNIRGDISTLSNCQQCNFDIDVVNDIKEIKFLLLQQLSNQSSIVNKSPIEVKQDPINIELKGEQQYDSKSLNSSTKEVAATKNEAVGEKNAFVKDVNLKKSKDDKKPEISDEKRLELEDLIDQSIEFI